MPNYPYDDLTAPLDTVNLERLNNNYDQIQADIQSADSASQQRDTAITNDYTAKLDAQKTEYTGRLDAQRDDYTTKFTQQQNEYRSGFSALSNDYNNKMTILRTDFNRSTAAQETRIDNIVNEISTEAFEQVVSTATVNRSFNPVATFTDLTTTYPNAQPGDAVQTLDDNKTYRFNGTQWVFIEQFGSGPFTNVYERLNDQRYYVSVKEFGATGDGTTDDTQAIQNAIASMGTGGVLYFPSGQYLVSKNTANNYIFKIDKPTKIKGEGFVSTIRVKADVPNTCDVFYINPNMDFGGEFYGVHDLLIFPMSPVAARHVFHFDVSEPGHYMSKMYMSDVYVQQHGGKAFRVTNAENKADGFFASTIERCTFYGGIDMERSGDSIVFRDCTITGEGRGVRVKSVALPLVQNFASQFILDNCNITSKAGALAVEFAKNITIIGGNMEQTHLFGGSVIDVSGTDHEVINFTMERTHLTVFGDSGPTCNNVRLDNVNKAKIDLCSFANETGGVNLIIDTNAKNVTIGKNRFEGGTQLVNNAMPREVEFTGVNPLVKVSRDSDTPIASGEVLYIPFNTEEFDNVGMHSNTTNSTWLSCKVPGIYRISASVAFSGDDVDGRRMIAIQWNRTKDVANTAIPASPDAGSLTVVNAETVMRLEVGDYLEVWAFQSSGSGLQIKKAGDYSPTFVAEKISD